MQKIATVLKLLLPRLDAAIFIMLFFSALTLGPRMLNIDGDLGRHITIGNYILHNLKIPTWDIFSHTMTGQRIIPHEWLAQLIFGIIQTFLGLNGVVLLIATLIAITFTLTYRELLRRNIFRILIIFITLLAAYASSLHWLTRPHIFTFLFVAMWAYLLENEKSRIWLFPLIMVIWANTHGAFIAGFVIWAGHMAGWLWDYLHNQDTKEKGAKLALIGVLSLAVTFINPAGWRLWETSVGYLGNHFLVDKTIEYQSPNFHDPSAWPFLMMLALGIIALGLGGRLRPHESILFTGWTIMSLYSARNIPLFAIITAPYIGAAIQPIIEKVPILQRVDQSISRVEYNIRGGIFSWLAIILLIMASQSQLDATANQFNSNIFPVQAADWLQANPQQGKMFNNFVWGGYILYRLWPEQTVFIDGQTDFYGESLAREYTKVIALNEGWEATLKKYGVSWVILPSNEPLIKALQDGLGWIIVYQDDTTAIVHEP